MELRGDQPEAAADFQRLLAGEELSILDQAHENLEQGLAAARTFLSNLRPPPLDSAGLEPALRQQTAGGHLELSSQPHQGTQVVLRLPE